MNLYEELFRDQPEYINFDCISFYSGQPYKPCPDGMTTNIPKPLTNMIDFVRVGIKNYVKIDFVGLSDGKSSELKNNVHKFIDECFDFDFCKCWWNGENMFTNHHNNIINKKCQLINLPLINSMYYKYDMETLLEYQNKIKNNIFDEVSDHVGLIKRLNKYRERGFQIDTSDLQLITPDAIKNNISNYLNNLHRILGSDVALYFDMDNADKNNNYLKAHHAHNGKAIYFDIKTMFK